MGHQLRFARWGGALAAILLPLAVLFALYQLSPPLALPVGRDDSRVYHGFYALERSAGTTFRWSGPTGEIVLPQVGQPRFGLATVSTWAPAERPAAPVTLAAGGQQLAVIPVSQGGRTLQLLVPRSAVAGGDVRITLQTTPWHPAQETRDLGVGISAFRWQGSGSIVPPLRQLWAIPALAIAFALLLRRLGAREAHAWPIAATLCTCLAVGAALLPLSAAPLTLQLLSAVLITRLALVLRIWLPRILPRGLPALATLQFVGYSALWAILHVSRAAPAFDNGWFTPRSRYELFVEALPPVAWLLARPTVTRICFLVIIAFLSALYFWTLSCVREREMPRLRTVITLTVAAALPLLILPRLLSTDVYSYALYGRMAAVYGENPFITRPDQFRDDPVFSYIAWTTTPSVYGPAMVGVSLPLTWLALALGDTPPIYVLVYKVAALAAFVGSMAVMHRLLRRLYPQRMLWGLLAFAWHPLVLIELVGSAHNDSLMLLLVLVGLLLALHDRRLLTVLVLTVAGMVKLVALALIPFYAMYMLYTAPDRRIWLVMRQVIVSLGVIAALYAPYWVGPQTLDVLSTAPPLWVMRSGPAAWVWLKLNDGACVLPTPVDQPGAEIQQSEPCRQANLQRVRAVSLALFAVVYAALVLWPIRERAVFVDRALWGLVAYTLLAAISFRAWYVTWVVALVPLMRRPRLLLLWWGCTIFLDYSRLEIRERNLLAFVPVLVLLGQLAWEARQRLLAQRSGHSLPVDDSVASA